MGMTVLRFYNVETGQTWWLAFDGKRLLGVFDSLADARDAVDYERDRRARTRRGLDGRDAGPARRRPPQVGAEVWIPVVDALLSGTAAEIHLELVDGGGRAVPQDGRDLHLMLARFRDAHRPVVRRPVIPFADDPGEEPAVVPSQPR